MAESAILATVSTLLKSAVAKAAREAKRLYINAKTVPICRLAPGVGGKSHGYQK